MDKAQSAQITQNTWRFVDAIGSLDGEKALKYTSARCHRDKELTQKYRLLRSLGQMDVTGKASQSVKDTFRGATDNSEVFRVRSDPSAAVLTSDNLEMDLGFVREGDTWKVDYQTCDAAIRGGFVKDKSDRG